MSANKSGYTPCKCRDCFETVIGVYGETFCDDCTSEGCADYQGVKGMSQDCQAAGACDGDIS